MQTTTLTPTIAAPLAVVGADLDPSLTFKLTEGDKVLVEINGYRIYSDNSCPLVAEQPWIVVSNVPPLINNPPKEQHKLVLRHQQSRHDITLHYKNMLHLPKNQPAVFLEEDPNLSQTNGKANSTFIILQMVAHWTGEVESEFPAYDKAAARLVLLDNDIRPAIFEQWGAILTDFRTGPLMWRHKSVLRLANRSHVRPIVFEKMIQGDFTAIESLDTVSLFRIHEAFYWLQYFLEQSVTWLERDTLDDGVGGHAEYRPQK